ncbi:hypothetical protein N7466_003288 [Penicillium verhagenii]|uniref:uncharacterized protein n=1 Tax=Penicillium verhagenii TaxID=1562060 RepID=UPI0025452EAC|nr:uncharacterized protein N7466_003288 [Penicillium verhagenii]KAJ5936838.1 hypothetical protein N7466_003288 [Penicillium verhagenii]
MTASTAPLPAVEEVFPDQYKDIDILDVTHFVVQMNDIIQHSLGIPYDPSRSLPYWHYICRLVSQTLFQNDSQLEWLNTLYIWGIEHITLTNPEHNVPEEKKESQNVTLRAIEIGFSRTQPGEKLKLCWHPARKLTTEHVYSWLQWQRRQDRENPA